MGIAANFRFSDVLNPYLWCFFTAQTEIILEININFLALFFFRLRTSGKYMTINAPDLLLLMKNICKLAVME